MMTPIPHLFALLGNGQQTNGTVGKPTLQQPSIIDQSSSHPFSQILLSQEQAASLLNPDLPRTPTQGNPTAVSTKDHLELHSNSLQTLQSIPSLDEVRTGDLISLMASPIQPQQVEALVPFRVEESIGQKNIRVIGIPGEGEEDLAGAIHDSQKSPLVVGSPHGVGESHQGIQVAAKNGPSVEVSLPNSSRSPVWQVRQIIGQGIQASANEQTSPSIMNPRPEGISTVLPAPPIHTEIPRTAPPQGNIASQGAPVLSESAKVSPQVNDESVKNLVPKVEPETRPVLQSENTTRILSQRFIQEGIQPQGTVHQPTRQNPLGNEQKIPVTASSDAGVSTIPKQGTLIAEPFSGQPSQTSSTLTQSTLGKELVGTLAHGPSLSGQVSSVNNGEGLVNGVEHAGKQPGIDFSSGHGAQAGFQQSAHSPFSHHQASPHSLHSGGRVVEERAFEFPTQALQRLQMDVQVSESNRVQIDVGVQQRQVYAGLVMDQSLLRNLALQSVPELENQLAQADLELQEFSAEVREQDSQGNQPSFSRMESPEGSGNGTRTSREPGPQLMLEEGNAEPGLHFVA